MIFSGVAEFRFTGYDADGVARFGPRTVSKAATVELSPVPVSVTTLVIEYLDAQRSPLGIGSHPVVVVAGQVTVLHDPPFDDVTSALLSLEIRPSQSSLAAGRTQPFSAHGLFANGSLVDLTSSVTWASSTPSVATVEAHGLVRAVHPGTTSIVASLGSVQGSAELTVTEAVLVSISVEPKASVIALGQQQSLSATGIFSDGSIRDLTSTVTWVSSAPAVVGIQADGLASGLAIGQARLRATETESGLVGEATLTVSQAVLVELEVTPQPQNTLSPGQTVALTAIGTYSNGSSLNLSSAVTWTSSAPEIASVDSGGLATAVSAGKATVSASLQGVTGSVELTVDVVSLFVSNTQGNSWARFWANTGLSGDVPPLSLVVGAATELSSPEGVFFDPTHEEVWVGAQVDSFVSVFAASDSGALAPKRRFATSGFPRGVAYDAGRDVLYVTNSQGNVASLEIFDNPRALHGGTPVASRRVTGFGGAYGLFLDAANDRVYMVETGGTLRVCIFDNASTVDGSLSVVPFREVRAGLDAPRGVTVDRLRDILYVTNDTGSVAVFANASTTHLPPSATAILGGDQTLLDFDLDGITVDPVLDEIYVSVGVSADRICIFSHASSLSGVTNVAPTRVLEGAQTGLQGPGGLFLYRAPLSEP